MKNKLMIAATVAASVGFWASVHADTIAFTPSGQEIVPGEPSGNDALFFTPTVDITVTALGYYDGVTYPHGVGLYEVTSVVGNPTDYSGSVSGVSGATTLTSISGTQLAYTSIAPGVGSLVNGFRYNDIAPVTLLAGQLYAIDGYYGGTPDKGVYAYGGEGPNPLINYHYYLWDYAATGL